MPDKYLDDFKPFSLSEAFLEKYKNEIPPFGFNGLGYLVYMRTYSRLKEDGTNEQWYETVARVINGTYNMQKKWIMGNRLYWNEWKAQASAKEMFTRMYEMKFLPPGRGLWAMGTPITEEKGLYAALNNCAFVSTDDLKQDHSKPFTFLMDASMLGVGVGFDTKGSGEITIKGINKDRTPETYQIPDTREGWVESVGKLIDAYFGGHSDVVMDYSLVRGPGEPIRGFGGVSSGPEPLQDLHENIRQVLEPLAGKEITVRAIVDIMNFIGKAVVAGNVRRTAEIAIGEPFDEEYLNLKNYDINPERAEYGWTSNNSIYAELGMDYTKAADRTWKNGEPGYIWLENIQGYSRIKNGMDNKDHRAKGVNPCIIGDTLIAVADGRNTVKVKDLVGTTYPVYTIKDKKVTIGKTLKTWKTKENTEVWKLVLDDGSHLFATPDHKIMLRNGKYKELKDLQKGESLMPFNSYISNKHYRQISSNIGRDRRQYRLIAEYNDLIVDPKITAIHHKDFNSFNDRIENLYAMLHEDHRSLHSEKMKGKNNPLWKMSEESRNKFLYGKMCGEDNGMFGKKHKKSSKIIIGEKSKNNWETQRDFMIESIRNGMTDEVKKHISDKMKEKTIWVIWECPVCGNKLELTEYQVLNRVTCSKSCSNRFRATRKEKMYNHKVESVEFYGYEDVYDITVEDTHNFGIITQKFDDDAIVSTGIFIHNCVEQSLESYELCNLVETFPMRHENLEDYLKTLKYAYLYSKTVTLGQTHWPETNRVMLRNRRIGCSVSGVAQFVTKHGIDELRKWLESGYDTIQSYDNLYSEWFAIPLSIKTTSVKPSGTVSLLTGATPGVHYPESRFYIRRMRLSKNSKLVKPLKKAGYNIEDAFGDPNSLVVDFPIDVGEGIRTVSEVSMWEQLSLAAFMQKHWADNQVSCTITFDPDTEGADIANALNFFQYQLKGISFLPKLNGGAYPQMPYEEITADEYKEKLKKLKKLDFTNVEQHEAVADRFCSNDICEILSEIEEIKEGVKNEAENQEIT